MKRYLYCAVLILLFLSGPVYGEQGNAGVVSKVFDGDSLIVKLARGRSVEIRLAEIDAPEQDQPYGNQSRDELRKILGGKRVRIKLYDVDAYGRIVAHIYRLDDQLHVNAWMVAHGLAWVYPKYAEDQNLFALQKDAQEKQLGLWGLAGSQPVPPWVWRRRK